MQRISYSEWGHREYRSALAGIAQPPKAQARSAMSEMFQATLSGRPLLAVNRASAGLCLALQVFRRVQPGRKEVIVPAYICPIVIRAIEQCGLQPVAVDIGPELNLLPRAVERAISRSTLAVVVAHMYGCPAPIQELEAVCRESDVLVIDDAAQALGVEVDGRPLGTFGDMGMISFGQSKPVVAGSHNAGGLLVINNPEFESLLQTAWQALPEPQNFRADILRFIWNYQWNRWTEMPSYLTKKYLIAIGGDEETMLGPSKMSNLAASIAVEQLKTLPRRIAGRRNVAERYQRELSDARGIAFPQYAPGRFLARILLRLPPLIDAAAVRSDLRRLGVRTRLGYPVYGFHGAHPPTQAMALRPRLIEVPSHSQSSDIAIATIVKSLASILPGAANSDLEEFIRKEPDR